MAKRAPPPVRKASRGGKQPAPAARSSRRSPTAGAAAEAQAEGKNGLVHEDRRAQAVSIYARVTRIIWQRLSPTFGSRTINAIARNVIARNRTRRPPLELLSVNEEGLVWDELMGAIDRYRLPDLEAALNDFVDEFFEALSNMIGRLVVGKIFKEAEQAARKGGEP